MVAELMTVPEVAEIFKTHQNTIYAQIKSGKLACIRIGKSIRISREQIEKYLFRDNTEEANYDRATIAGQRSRQKT